MVKVFNTRFPCQCHKLNLLLEHTFSDANLDEAIEGALNSVRALVTYFKQTGYQPRYIANELPDPLCGGFDINNNNKAAVIHTIYYPS